MAKLPALVSALNECDGRDRATIEHIARTVREAGHIPTTKRGSGAADMTAREAANLFLGANGCDLPKDAPLAIDRFRALQQHICYTREGVDVEAFKAVAEAGTFGIALEALIDGMGEILSALDGFLQSGYADADLARDFQSDLRKYSWRGGFLPIRLDVELRRYSAQINLRVYVASPKPGEEVGGAWRTEFSAEYLPDFSRLESGFYGPRLPSNDRSVTVNVSGFTLLKLWEALHSSSDATK